MRPIEQIDDAFGLLVAHAFGESKRAFASIPARPDHDADLIVAAAIRELAQLRDRERELLGQCAALREALRSTYEKVGSLVGLVSVGGRPQERRIKEAQAALDGVNAALTSTSQSSRDHEERIRRDTIDCVLEYVEGAMLFADSSLPPDLQQLHKRIRALAPPPSQEDT